MNNDERDFPFDEWTQLATHDPQAFELTRARILRSLIEAAPATSRRRLEGLQWQIDCARERADNPLAACIRISGMMWDTVLGENGLVDSIEQLTGVKPVRERTRRSAAVLPFHRHRDSS